MNVKEIMHGKTIVDPDISIIEAAKIMKLRKIGSVLVKKSADVDISDDKKYFGIVTERDIVGVVALNKDLRVTKLHHIMNSVITIDHTKDIEEATRLMVKNKIRRLPVTKDGEIIGIITMKDIIRRRAVHIASRNYSQSSYQEGSGWG